MWLDNVIMDFKIRLLDYIKMREGEFDLTRILYTLSNQLIQEIVIQTLNGEARH